MGDDTVGPDVLDEQLEEIQPYYWYHIKPFTIFFPYGDDVPMSRTCDVFKNKVNHTMVEIDDVSDIDFQNHESVCSLLRDKIDGLR